MCFTLMIHHLLFLYLLSRLQIQLGVNMPARAEQIPGEEEKQTFHEAYDVVLYLGIIDILQEYNMSKKIEHAYKSLQFDSLSISAVDPTFYSRRFLEFIQKVFPPNVITSWYILARMRFMPLAFVFTLSENHELKCFKMYFHYHVTKLNSCASIHCKCVWFNTKSYSRTSRVFSLVSF